MPGRGFFYVTGHGVPADLLAELADASAEFFALPLADKRHGARRQGLAGYFPVGAELTSGRPDLKEDLYFGAELADDHPRVLAGFRCTAAICSRNRFPGCARWCSPTSPR